jgi:GNAT superfamily N-acetyltransferase
MPAVSRFTNENLPEHFAHQIRDFIRIHWFDPFQFGLDAPAMPDEWQPVYFVVGESKALFSHAAVVTRTVECNGQSYRCGGLGSVLTYPAFRNRGYGSQAVAAATEYLMASDFDVALLWTDADKADFYARCGWEHDPSMRTVAGDRFAPALYDAFTMFMLLSKQAQERRADFEGHPIYIGEYGW